MPMKLSEEGSFVDNAKYRVLIKTTLDFEPEILKRYVNFMNNPDEKTAAEQFSKGDKYKRSVCCSAILLRYFTITNTVFILLDLQIR